jgi:hypothetical protein
MYQVHKPADSEQNASFVSLLFQLIYMKLDTKSARLCRIEKFLKEMYCGDL